MRFVQPRCVAGARRAVVLAIALAIATAAAPAPMVAQAPATDAATAAVEEIYIARSLRESREAPTAFCAPDRTGFAPASVEDTYSFWSTSTRASDGRVTDTHVEEIGTLRACFGPNPDGEGSFFYSEGALGAATFVGRGSCIGTDGLAPEPGISVLRCFMRLTDLPPEYVGGQLTTNTLTSRNALGTETDPPGYTQPSIATIRLWRRR